MWKLLEEIKFKTNDTVQLATKQQQLSIFFFALFLCSIRLTLGTVHVGVFYAIYFHWKYHSCAMYLDLVLFIFF